MPKQRKRDGTRGGKDKHKGKALDADLSSIDDRWARFSSEYAVEGWFDYGRKKTLSAMRTLCERMPQQAKNNLPQGPFLIVFAPDPRLLGKEIDGHFIYLSPILECCSQECVDATVAHEFAHMLVGHESGDQLSRERETDLLIQKWGYHLTNSCGWQRRDHAKAKAS
jgi:predicted metal-dependent peptidase